MKSKKGFIYAIISSSTFGLIPLFAIPILRSGMNTPSILFYRFSIATVVMGLIALVRKSDFRISTSEGISLGLLGMLYAATALALLMSYNFMPSGMATTIHFLYPILVTAIMVMFFGESKSFWLIVAAIASLAGVALMSWSSGAVSLKGLGIALTTVVTYSTYIVGVNKSGVSRIDIFPLTFYLLLAGTLLFGTYAMLTTGIEPISDIPTAINILLLAILPTVISDVTLILAVKYAGSTITSILGSMEPMAAVTIGVLCFAEPISINSVFGLLLILCSVILVIVQGSRKAAK